MTAAMDLGSERVFAIHRGNDLRTPAENTEAVPVTKLSELCASIGGA